MILDYVKKYEFDETTPFNHNLLVRLETLRAGIYHLGFETRKMELLALQDPRYTSKRQKGKAVIMFIIPEAIVLDNYFNWFAISVCNYARLVETAHQLTLNNWSIDSFEDPEVKKIIKRKTKSYLEEVAPEISTWRNKISAHLTMTDPLSSDNLSMINNSMFSTIGYHTPLYTIGEFKVCHKDTGDIDLKHWALTNEYYKLHQRYWRNNPNSLLPKLPPL